MPGSTQTRRVSAKELRLGLTGHLQHALQGVRTVVTVHNRAVAALIPIEDYTALMQSTPSTASPKEEPKMNVIVVANLSGGEGKSTCAREFAYVCAEKGLRVGIIDLDPQASLTKSLGLHDAREDGQTPPALGIRSTAFYAMTDPTGDLPAPIPVHGVDIWPSNKHLSKLDGMLNANSDDMGNLRAAIWRLEGYDVIIIDTTPVRTALLHAAIAAADHVVTPVSEFKGMENLGNLLEVLDTMRGFSPNIGIRLYVPNRQNSRQRFYRDLQEELRTGGEHVRVAAPIEDRSAPVNKALVARLPVVLNEPHSPVAEEFRAAGHMMLEVLSQWNEGLTTVVRPTVTPQPSARLRAEAAEHAVVIR